MQMLASVHCNLMRSVGKQLIGLLRGETAARVGRFCRKQFRIEIKRAFDAIGIENFHKQFVIHHSVVIAERNGSFFKSRKT